MRKILLLLFVFALVACNKNKTSNVAIIKVNDIPDTCVILNKWQVLGPFSSNDKEHFINEDNLQLFKYKESGISFLDFMRISSSRSLSSDTIRLDSCFQNKFVFSGKIPLDFNEILKVNKEKLKGNVYCACLILSKKNISTRLHFSSTGAEKIWINGKLICSTDYSKPLGSYTQFIPIKLKQGQNVLLVKVNKLYTDWQMYARLENESPTALKRYFGLHNHFILYGSIMQFDSIVLDPIFPRCNGRLTMLDQNKNIVFSDTLLENKYWSHCVSTLKKGIYQVRFSASNVTLVQDLYRGDIHDTIPKIIKELKLINLSGKNKDNIEALIFRYNYLLTQTYPGDMKYVSLFMQLSDAFNALQKGKNPFNHTSGCFIRSYISDIDSSIQYYILHVPSTYKKNVPSSLAIAIPATVYGNLPYLKSFRVGNSKLIDFFQDMAEKYNMILIEPGSRRYSRPNYNTIEEAELFNILNEVESDYNIDKNRIYLTGTCSGGNEALKLTVQFPDRFAAIGLVAPEIIYPEESNNSAIMFIKNIINVPIFDTHSLIDRHIAVERSEVFNEIAEAFSFKDFKYIRMPNEFPMYYPDDFFEDALEFCSKRSLNPSPKEIYFSTAKMLYNKSFWITINAINYPDTAHIHAKMRWNTLTIEKSNVLDYSVDLRTLPYEKDKTLKIVDNGKVVFKGVIRDSVLHIALKNKENRTLKSRSIAGPLSHVFVKKFIVVKGTTGSKEETTKISALADTIVKYWMERYFVTCRVKKDTEITKKDIEDANLVLLGNPASNAIFNRLSDSLPVKISNSNIQLFKKVIKGDKLCFYMVFPNPLNKSKYVALIGYNNPAYISLGSETGKFDDISDYGWYDYKIWDEFSSSQGLEFGNFNQYWKLP
ncbi:MAG TPA: hypothetical protein PK252_08690 [Bacteroidales bacterium]|nr:hypothetical protein [Bacteroidales bacterium]